MKTTPIPVQDMKDGRRRLRFQFDLTYHGHPGKKPEGESDTEPDMTLTLGQLLERHSRGGHVPMQDPVYFEMEIPTIKDITDVEQYKDQLELRLQQVKLFIQNEKDQKEAEKQREADRIANSKEKPDTKTTTTTNEK